MAPCRQQEENFQVQQFRRTASGIEGLDRVLNGGFIDGASYIVQGRPGAGKTILSNQIAFARAAAGCNVLYVTLLSESHERLFQALSVLDFFDADKLGQEIIYISVFQTLRDEGLGAVVKLLRSETKRHNATLLVFDGLLNARDRAETDLDVKTFVAEIQDQAAFVGCTVLLLTSTRLDDNSPEHTMVDGVIDLSVELFGVRSVRQLQVRKSRGSAALGGLHQYEITKAGVTVYPRLESAVASADTTDAPENKRLSTGCPSLDALIQGGLPQGSVTLLAGPTGSGKTTLGLHFLSLGSVQEPALHFGFFETPARLQMKATSLGIQLPNDIPGAFEIVWNPLAENLLDKLAYQLLEWVTAGNVRRLFIDGLGGFERAATHPPRLVEFFATLGNQLRGIGVTTVITWELREIPSAHILAPPSAELSALVDNLILMRQLEADHTFQPTVAIQKMRDSVFDQSTHYLGFTSKGLVVGPRLSGRVRPHPLPDQPSGL